MESESGSRSESDLVSVKVLDSESAMEWDSGLE